GRRRSNRRAADVSPPVLGSGRPITGGLTSAARLLFIAYPASPVTIWLTLTPAARRHTLPNQTGRDGCAMPVPDQGRSRPMNTLLGVPLCDLGGQFRELEGDLLDAVARVLRSGQVILGPEVAALEQEVAQYCGAGYGVGCGSGTDALLLAL